MSERGSFVTEFLYCPGCLEKMKKVLCKNEDKYLQGKQLNHYPIIAGRIGGTYFGEELVTFQCQLFHERNAPCHPVRVAVISDNSGAKIFIVGTDGSVEEVE